MNGLREMLGGRRRGNTAAALPRMAREVVDRRRSVQGALNEMRQPGILDPLNPDDFVRLDTEIVDQAPHDREFAVVLARLVHAAARAKGFDREIVDAALRLDGLLPSDDPSRERDKLLRDAYAIAQRSGYIEGGQRSLARLGHRALEAGETERARHLLREQLAIGDETSDGIAEIETSLVLGDLARRDGDRREAQTLYRRAGRSAQRLGHYRGIAEALIRQIDMMPDSTDVETLAALQRQASEAARRTVDLGLQSRIVLSLAETLERGGRRDEALAQVEYGLSIARQIGDLALEGRCLATLVHGERQRGELAAAVAYERTLIDLEDRLGNRIAAADWAAQLGADELTLGHLSDAIEAYDRALSLAFAVGDLKLEQRALGGLGVSYSLLDRPADALDHLMRALDLARRTADATHEAQWLGSIGQVLWRFDQPDDALHALNEAVAIARRLDDAELQASILTLLGQIHASRGHVSRARESYARALELNRRLGLPVEQVHLLTAMAGLATDSGHIGSAVTLCEQAIRLATTIDDRPAVARLHLRLGRLAQRRHDPTASLEHLRRAVELADQIDHPVLLSQSLQFLATAQHAAGDPGAGRSYRRALALTQEQSDLLGEAMVRMNFGSLLASDGRPDEGLVLLNEARQIAAELGPPAAKLMQRVTALLATLSPAGPAAHGRVVPQPSPAENVVVGNSMSVSHGRDLLPGPPVPGPPASG